MTETSDPPTHVHLFTDGGCSRNPGPGGWGVLMIAREGAATVKERTLSGGEAHTTNNRMELLAALPAFGFPAFHPFGQASPHIFAIGE